MGLKISWIVLLISQLLADQLIKFYGVSKLNRSCTCHYEGIPLEIKSGSITVGCNLPMQLRNMNEVGEGQVILNCQENAGERTYVIQLSPFISEVPPLEICLNLPAATTNELPTTLLASYPRSGNSWTRKLVEGSTGYCTGSVYNDQRLLHGGFVCENRTKDVVLLKTHGTTRNEKITGKVDGVLLLSRNYFDSALSYFHYSNTKSHHGNVEYNSTDPNKWSKHVAVSSSGYHRFFSYWLSYNSSRVLRITYENMHERKKEQLIKIVDFLGLPRDYQRIECAIARDKVSDTGREGSCQAGNSIEYFSPGLLDAVIRKLETILDQLGYQNLLKKAKSIIAFQALQRNVSEL